MSGMYAVIYGEYIKLEKSLNGGHSSKLRKDRSITKIRRQYYNNWITNSWMLLPAEVVSVLSPELQLSIFLRELELRNCELELKFRTKKLNPQINLPFLQC